MCRGWCNTMLRATICSVNLIIMLLGVAISLSGVWLLVTDFLSPDSFLSPTILSLSLLVTGLLTITLSFLACCGSLLSSSCLLGTFLALTISIIAGEVALGVAVYTKVRPQH